MQNSSKLLISYYLAVTGTEWKEKLILSLSFLILNPAAVATNYIL